MNKFRVKQGGGGMISFNCEFCGKQDSQPDINNSKLCGECSIRCLKMKILNVGSGNQSYGSHRIDMYFSPNVTQVCNLEAPFPFKDEMFDEIYCKCVLEHIKNLDNFASEFFRVLKKGGKIFIRTDYAGYLPTYLFKSHEHNRILEVQYYADAYKHDQGEDAHYHLFVESHLKKLFKKFKNHKFRYVSGGRNKLVNIILTRIPYHLGAIHIEMIAEK